MLNERYLTLGLNALSRAHALDYFADGHRGAAIIAAHYLCRENNVEDGVAGILAGLIDEHWAHTDLCAPFPAERPDPALVDRILAALTENMGPLRQAAHNVILPSLALKAFADVPEALTPARAEGICRLIGCFDTAEDIAPDADNDLPDLGAPGPVAEFMLAETLRTMDAFTGRGQGWSGHMLTSGRAVVDLLQLGYADVAQKAYHTFRVYVKRARMGPLDTDKPRAEHPPVEWMPLQLKYWESRRTRGIEIGHLFKYPYGFYGLMALATDADLEQRCMREAYRVF
jgi:hypothetical protein